MSPLLYCGVGQVSESFTRCAQLAPATWAHRFLVRLGGWVVVRLKKQLYVVRPFGQDDREPSELACRDVRLLNEAQDLRIEPKGLVLVVNDHACQFDLRRSLRLDLWSETLRVSEGFSSPHCRSLDVGRGDRYLEAPLKDAALSLVLPTGDLIARDAPRRSSALARTRRMLMVWS